MEVAAADLRAASLALEAGDKAEAKALMENAAQNMEAATADLSERIKQAVDVTKKAAGEIIEDPSIPNVVTQILAALGGLGVIGIGGNAVRKRLSNHKPT